MTFFTEMKKSNVYNVADVMDKNDIKSIKKGTVKREIQFHNNRRHHMDNHSLHSHQKIRLKRENKDKCVSYLAGFLHCYNVFLLILGSGVLGLGVWLLVKDYSSREISTLVGSRLFEFLTYGLIAGGGSVTILAFCGCCGTMRQDKFVLGFYGAVLTIVFLLLGGCCTLGIIFRKNLANDITAHFEESLIKHYGIDVQKNSENRLITDAWDAMQRTLECCGAHGDEDGLTAWAIYRRDSKWYKENGKLFPYVPESCCVEGKSKHKCQGIDNDVDGYPVQSPPLHSLFSDRNDALNKIGCYDRLMSYLKQNSLYISIVAGIIPLLLIIGMFLAFYLCSKVKSDDDDEDEDEEDEVEV